MLGKAIAIASKVHETQQDKGGHAYILHPIRVMMRLRTTDEELMQIAILHDVVEDSDEWTISRLREEGFSTRVIQALTLLTHTIKKTLTTFTSRKYQLILMRFISSCKICVIIQI